jgi:aminopeptidase N
LTIDQKQCVDEKNPPYRFDVEVGFADGDRERVIRARVEREHETVTVPLDFEPKIVRYDPGAFVLGSVTFKLGVDVSAAVLNGKADAVAKIRAARELAKEGSAAARDALRAAFQGETFWGVLAEAAAAIGKTKSPWGRALLVDFAGHEHPKVRRAVAAALGSFRGEEAATALLPLAKDDKSYLVRGAALASLGRTRDPRAFDVLAAAVGGRSWNGIVEAGAVRGLAELADARALKLAVDAAKPDRDEGLRRAAVAAIGRIGELVESERRAAVQALEERLDDPMFLVQLSAIAATETLADSALLPALDRLSQSAFDGRVRRDAMEAAIRVREAAKVPAQVSAMQSDLDGLREEQRKLEEKIEALSRS